MAKKSNARKESITISRSGFITLVLFIIAISILAAYAFLNYTV
jgi:hypothetical protein